MHFYFHKNVRLGALFGSIFGSFGIANLSNIYQIVATIVLFAIVGAIVGLFVRPK